MRTGKRLLRTGFLVLLPSWPVLILADSETVSPGDIGEFSQIQQTCPTFSWAISEYTVNYEIVIYSLADPGSSLESGTVVLNENFPAGVGSWTPPAHSCLKPGEHYAWVVTSYDDRLLAHTSEPRFFKISRFLDTHGKGRNADSDPTGNLQRAGLGDAIRIQDVPVVTADNVCTWAAGPGCSVGSGQWSACSDVALCPAGQSVVSGGCAGGTVNIAISQSEKDGNGWRCRWIRLLPNLGSTSVNAQVCCQGP